MEGEDILVYGHFWAAMFLVLGLARPLCFYCQFYFFGNVSERLSTRLRIKSFKHLLSLPCSFYDDSKHSATKLSNRLSADASNVKAAVDARLGSVLMTSVSLVLAVITSSLLCWELTIQVCTIPESVNISFYFRFYCSFLSSILLNSSMKRQLYRLCVKTPKHLKKATRQECTLTKTISYVF